MVTLLSLNFTVECPIPLLVLPAWGTVFLQLSSPVVVTAHAPVPGPPLTSQVQEVSQATSRFLSAALGHPSTCCSGCCLYLALLCVPEAAPGGWHHSGSSLVQTASWAQPMEGTDRRPEDGRSENQGYLYLPRNTHPLRLPTVLEVAAFLNSHPDAVTLIPVPAPLGPGSLWRRWLFLVPDHPLVAVTCWSMFDNLFSGVWTGWGDWKVCIYMYRSLL